MRFVGGARSVVVRVGVGGWVMFVGVRAEALPMGAWVGGCNVFAVSGGFPFLLSSVFDLLDEVR